jgi:hypothetical protein
MPLRSFLATTTVVMGPGVRRDDAVLEVNDHHI